MKTGNKCLSLYVRLVLILVAITLLHFCVPTQTPETFLASSPITRLQPPPHLAEQFAIMYASANAELHEYKKTAELVLKSTEEAVKSWKVVKVESKKVVSNSILWPVKGAITSKFGSRIHPVTHRRSFHNGIDIRGAKGTNVVCPTDGTVVDTGWLGAMGKMVKLKTGNGYYLYFGHLSAIKCKVGQKLSRGTVLGRVGATGRATGPHLHFAVVHNGDFINPLKYLSK